MARGGYREQGSDQAVRLVFRPGLSPWDVTLTTLGTMLVALVAMFASGALAWLQRDDDLAPLLLLPVALSPLVMRGLLRHAHEIVVGRETVTLRSRHFPLIWSEQRLARTAIASVARRVDWDGGTQLSLLLHHGPPVMLLMGYRLSADAAAQMSDTLDQALDPEQIEALADEHRPAPARVG